MKWAAGAVVLVAAAVGYAFRLPIAGSTRMWLALLVSYAVLASVALLRSSRKEELRPLLRFSRGDPSLGILLGFVGLFGAWLIARGLLPAESPGRAWLLRVFLLPGEISGAGASAALLALVGAEELVWRGWIQSELRERWGPRRGWIAAAVCYALAHAPTLFTLKDPAAGYNPLVVIAALGCGLGFGFVTERTGRLLPALFAHGVFSYFAATSFWLFV